MPSIRNRKQARVSKQLKAALADQFKRQKKLIEDAITAKALQFSFTKEQGAILAPPTIERWNEAADQIEREFGRDWFPVRLERSNAFSFRFVIAGLGPINPAPLCGYLSNRLLYLSAIKADPVYGWMSDLLFMACFVPEVRILREATDRHGWWWRKGRKRKQNIALNQAKAYADALSDEQQDQAGEFWRDIKRADAKLNDAVRSDRSYAVTLPVQLTKDED